MTPDPALPLSPRCGAGKEREKGRERGREREGERERERERLCTICAYAHMRSRRACVATDLESAPCRRGRRSSVGWREKEGEREWEGGKGSA